MGSPLRSALVLRLLESALFKRLFKYSAASAVAVVVGQTTLLIGLEVLEWPALAANLLSVSIGAIPNYTINRYWTWQQTGKNRLWGEIIPFWVMALLGSLLSMAAVAVADSQTDGNTLVIMFANLSGFGVVWIAKFVILDKVMWRVVHDLHPELDLEPPETTLASGLTGQPNGSRPNGSRETDTELERATDRS